MFALGLVVPAVGASGGPKVVVVVGPVGQLNRDYRAQADQIVAEARRYTANVVLVRSPHATWQRVRQVAQGASVFIYLGHGNGYPSVYGRFHGDTKNGLGLDPPKGANGSRHINYGEDRIRASIRFAPNAAVLLYRLCYASGNTEPGLSEGSTAQSKQRVDGYGAGFLAAGAGIVFADGYPKPAMNYLRQLFTTDRTMLQVFGTAPNRHGHLMGPYRSIRTPGSRYAMDPNRGGADPSGFYRSLVGNLELTTREVTGRPLPTQSPPPSSSEPPSPSGEDPTPTPTPEMTAEPTPTPIVEPTAEPTPSPTAEPTATSIPEPTPAPG